MVSVEINIPEGISIQIDKLNIKMKGPKGELDKTFKMHNISIKQEENKLIISGNTKMMVNTLAAHIRNMIKGVTEGYERKMKMVYSHFPINLEIKDDSVLIKNFIGEKNPRKIKLIKGVTLDIKAPYIYIRGMDKEAVHQMAANLKKSISGWYLSCIGLIMV